MASNFLRYFRVKKPTQTIAVQTEESESDFAQYQDEFIPGFVSSRQNWSAVREHFQGLVLERNEKHLTSIHWSWRPKARAARRRHKLRLGSGALQLGNAEKRCEEVHLRTMVIREGSQQRARALVIATPAPRTHSQERDAPSTWPQAEQPLRQPSTQHNFSIQANDLFSDRYKAMHGPRRWHWTPASPNTQACSSTQTDDLPAQKDAMIMTDGSFEHSLETSKQQSTFGPKNQTPLRLDQGIQTWSPTQTQASGQTTILQDGRMCQDTQTDTTYSSEYVHSEGMPVDGGILNASQTHLPQLFPWHYATPRDSLPAQTTEKPKKLSILARFLRLLRRIRQRRAGKRLLPSVRRVAPACQAIDTVADPTYSQTTNGPPLFYWPPRNGSVHLRMARAEDETPSSHPGASHLHTLTPAGLYPDLQQTQHMDGPSSRTPGRPYAASQPLQPGPRDNTTAGYLRRQWVSAAATPTWALSGYGRAPVIYHTPLPHFILPGRRAPSHLDPGSRGHDPRRSSLLYPPGALPPHSTQRRHSTQPPSSIRFHGIRVPSTGSGGRREVRHGTRQDNPSLQTPMGHVVLPQRTIIAVSKAADANIHPGRSAPDSGLGKANEQPPAAANLSADSQPNRCDSCDLATPKQKKKKRRRKRHKTASSARKTSSSGLRDSAPAFRRSDGQNPPNLNASFSVQSDGCSRASELSDGSVAPARRRRSFPQAASRRRSSTFQFLRELTEVPEADCRKEDPERSSPIILIHGGSGSNNGDGKDCPGVLKKAKRHVRRRKHNKSRANAAERTETETHNGHLQQPGRWTDLLCSGVHMKGQPRSPTPHSPPSSGHGSPSGLRGSRRHDRAQTDGSLSTQSESSDTESSSEESVQTQMTKDGSESATSCSDTTSSSSTTESEDSDEDDLKSNETVTSSGNESSQPEPLKVKPPQISLDICVENEPKVTAAKEPTKKEKPEAKPPPAVSPSASQRSVCYGLGSSYCVCKSCFPDCREYIGHAGDSEPTRRRKCRSLLVGLLMGTLVFAALLGLMAALGKEQPPLRFLIVNTTNSTEEDRT